MELMLSLEFDCYGCSRPVTVTLQCSGADLALPSARESVAAVNVPCPHCQRINRLLFEPRGVVRDVGPAMPALAVPEPSLN